MATIATSSSAAAASSKEGTVKEDLRPWVEKYRPETLDQLISHEDIISTIGNLMEAGRLPHLLFYGPPGTGKTSTILACARQMYGRELGAMVLQLNASDDRGIDIVRNEIKTFAGTKKLFSSGVKLIVLDEADHMTNDAQFALRRVMERYSKTTRFCVICNYVSKIIPALQSRCTKFRFAPLAQEQMMTRALHVIKAEDINVTDDGLSTVLRLSRGDMRKVLNILQATSMAHDVVSEETVCASTGSPLSADIKTVINWLLNAPISEVYPNIRALQVEKGLALTDIIREISPWIMSLKMPPNVQCFLLDKISDVQYRLAHATSETLQLGSLVGVFKAAVDMMASMGETASSFP
jgi:replication factor C subunit 3/5